VWRKLLQRVACSFIFIMRPCVAGWMNIPFLMEEKRIQLKAKRAGYIGTLFIGLGFAAGWTPCIGPIFGSILRLAASNPGQGLFYTVMYVNELAISFLDLIFFFG